MKEMSISMNQVKTYTRIGHEDQVNTRTEWACALQSIGKLPNLTLNKLLLQLEAEPQDFWYNTASGKPGCLTWNLTQWVKKSFGRAISNLEELSVHFFWN